jgi:hypothetical protein
MTEQDILELENFVSNWQRRENIDRTDGGWATYRNAIERINNHRNNINKMKTYKVQDRAAGNVIETGLTYQEAKKLVEQYESTDKADGTYTPDFYEITNTPKPYKAYIAANEYTPAIGSALSTTREGAIRNVKARYSEHEELYMWVVYVHDNGQEEKI